MATYRQKSDGSYQIFIPTLGWRPAAAGFEPGPNDVQFGANSPTANASEEPKPYNASSGNTSPVITGNGYTYTDSGVYDNETDPDRTNPLTLEQAKALRQAKKITDFQDLYGAKGYSIVERDGIYYVRDSSGKNVFATTTPSSLRTWYNENLYDGAKFSGNIWDPYGDLTVGPLEVNDQFPEGTGGKTVYVGEEGDPAPPTTTGLTFPPGSPFAPQPTTTGSTGSPITGTGGSDSPFNPNTPGMTLDTIGGEFPYNPPEGIPLNPLVFENPMKFSPYGTPAASFSNIAQYGGLPRSTGPWNEMGGYYGGNPYTEMPEGYRPPTSGRSPTQTIDSPWDGGVGGGGQLPADSDSPWLPPATPTQFPNNSAAPGPGYITVPGGGSYVWNPTTGTWEVGVNNTEYGGKQDGP